jgi:hypothetical protein
VSVAAVVAAAATIAPFVAFPNISLANYLSWIRLSGRTGLLMLLLRQNVEWALFMGLPLIASLATVSRSVDKRTSMAILGLLVGMCGVIIAGSKPGAGPYHLIPFVPVIALLLARVRVATLVAGQATAVAGFAFVGVVILVATAQQSQLIRTLTERRGISDAQDVASFATAHSGVVEMGYGQTEAMTFSRPLLVFRNGGYFIDQPAVREHQLAGVMLPEASTRQLRECRAEYWLIPKGEQPFSARNAYTAVLLQPLYPNAFLETFLATYKLSGSTSYFDVWQCGVKR